MLWFVLQMVPLLLGALAIGLLVGWLVWARTLRKTRSMHHTDTSVLRTQIASLGDESRRLQQRFAGVAQDLDAARVDQQTHHQELSMTREAFRVSQSNLAAAEADLIEQRRVVEHRAAEQLEQRQQLADRTVRISALEVQYATSERNLSMIRQEVETTRAQLSASEQDRAALEADLERSAGEVEAANARLGEAANEADQARVEHRRQFERVRLDLEAATRHLSSLNLAADAAQTGALRDRYLSDERAVEAERVAAEAVGLAESNFQRMLQQSQREALEAQTELRNEFQHRATVQKAVADRIDGHLRQALDAATIRANDAQAQVARLRREFEAAQATAVHETTTLRSNLALSLSDVALLQNEVAVSLSTDAAAKQELRQDSQAALDVARRQWMATQDRLSAAERQLAKKNRELVDLGNVLLRQQKGLTSGLSLLGIQHDVLRSEAIRSDSIRQRDVQRFETTQREREQAHQLAIQHWRRDLHHRFDDIEARKSELVQRDVRISELETSLLTTQADFDARLLASVQRNEALILELQTETLVRQSETFDLQSELERVSFERHLLEEERDRLHMTAEQLETARNGLADDLAEMSNERSTLTSQLSVAEAQASEQQRVLRVTIEGLEHDLARLAAERLELIAVVEQAEVRQTGSELANLATLAEVASKEHRIGEIEQQLESRSQDVLSLTQQLDEQAAMSAALRSTLAAAEAEHVEQARHLISEYDAQIADLDAQLHLAAADLTTATGRLHTLEDELQTATVRLQTSTADFESTQRDAATSEALAHALRVELDIANTDLESAQEDLNSRQLELVRFREDLNNSQATLASTDEQLVSVCSALDAAEADLLATRSALAQTEMLLTERQVEYETSQLALTAARDSIETGQLDIIRQRNVLLALDEARLVDLRFNEVREADRVARQVERTTQVLKLETAGRDARSEADGWRRELVELRKRFEVLSARPMQRVSLLELDITPGRTPTQEPAAARRVRGSSSALVAEVESESASQADTLLVDSMQLMGDNLQRIEGIGPKIAAALKAAGISTFVRLEAATIEQLRDALASAGLTFAPSLQTWSQQSGFLVRGDEEGFRSLTNVLVAGRDERKTEA